MKVYKQYSVMTQEQAGIPKLSKNNNELRSKHADRDCYCSVHLNLTWINER